MKKLLLGFLVLLFIASVSIAGEKEELQLQKLMLQERMGRLSAEFEIAKRALLDVEAKLLDISKREAEERRSQPEGVK